MFYVFDDEVKSIDVDEINKNMLTLGFITVGELEKLAAVFSLPKNIVELCRKKSDSSFLTKFINDDFTFIRLNIICNNKETNNELAIIISRNLMVIVNICDDFSFNQKCFSNVLSNSACESATLEKLICSFLETLARQCSSQFDEEEEIAALEKEVIDKNVDKSFTAQLIEKKRELLRLRAFYEQLIDVTEVYVENENEILDEKSIRLFKLFRDKAVRYKENTDILRESVTHLWDAYQTSIDAGQNEIMKLFTVVTSVFLPMTVIVGWYGMNFKYMPEISSRFGYPYVIFLNIIVVFSLIFVFKRKKWI
ncbi:MAG: CorA family divalent cation transporter [Eubacterium sp.]|nr:CorA family divalent cation transporter [Eubacterium sp.]